MSIQSIRRTMCRHVAGRALHLADHFAREGRHDAVSALVALHAVMDELGKAPVNETPTPGTMTVTINSVDDDADAALLRAWMADINDDDPCPDP